MFKTLSSKLTFTFGALFALVLLFLAVTSYIAVNNYAKDSVQKEMAATAKVLERLWRQKSDNLQTNAVLLSRDFGFQSAVATHDIATINSAYNNIKNRIHVDEGLIIGPNGEIVGGDAKYISSSVVNSLNNSEIIEAKNGIVSIDGQSYNTIAAPILAPDLMGWIVFAAKLDSREMKGLEELSPIPLSANIISLSPAQIWSMPMAQSGSYSDKYFDQLVKRQLRDKSAIVAIGKEGANIAVFTPLQSLDGSQTSALMLSYPLASALKAYQPLLTALFGLGTVCLVVIILLCSYLARKLMQPVAKLKSAADSLATGRLKLVDIEGQDEMSGLANAFNAMALSIRDREADINFMAKNDVRTGLPNRAAAEEYLGQTLKRDKDVKKLAVCLQLQKYDHLRSVWGSEVSHAAILKISEKIKKLDENAFVGRVSADTLIFIAPIADEKQLNQVMETILLISSGKVQIGEHNFDIQIRIGYSQSGLNSDEAVEIIEHSIIALDQAKAMNKSIAEFDDKIFAQLADTLRITDELHDALDGDKLDVFYQPKYNYRTRTISSCEALVRWFHPERGMVSPQKFVEIAEDTGYIADLTKQVLTKAIRDQAILSELGFEIDFSINYSGQLLSNADFNDETLRICKAARGKICLEITETAVITDPKIGIAAVENFTKNGIEISIDDFGTGLSSLAYLKLIPANELKIDRSFIDEIEFGQRDALLVRSTIDMAHGLGMKVTAEGVETETSISLLAAMGCDMAQGYGIGKPMPFDQFVNFVENFDADFAQKKSTPIALAESKSA